MLDARNIIKDSFYGWSQDLFISEDFFSIGTPPMSMSSKNVFFLNNFDWEDKEFSGQGKLRYNNLRAALCVVQLI